MKNVNITKTFLTLAICFSLAFTFCAEIAAQRDVQNKEQTTTQKPTTETQKETQSTTSKTSNDRKKIIVVLDFDNVSPQCKDEIYGKNVATQLSTAFSSTGKYTVIEKQRRDKIFEEINISQDERYEANTAAKVGKVLSASMVVLGTITECSPDTNVINIPIIGQAIRHTVKVSLAIRLVNINTAEVQDAINISESDTKTSGCVKGFCSVTAITPDLQISLFNKAVKKAVKKSVDQLTSIIEGKSSAVATTKIEEKPTSQTQTSQTNTTTTQKPTETSQTKTETTQTRVVLMPKVASISGVNIFIAGLAKDVKVGDRFSIMRGTDVKVPDTGEVIDFDGREIAIVQVIEVRENTVKAKIIKGTGIKIKDVVQAIK